MGAVQLVERSARESAAVAGEHALQGDGGSESARSNQGSSAAGAGGAKTGREGAFRRRGHKKTTAHAATERWVVAERARTGGTNAMFRKRGTVLADRYRLGRG
jgi:hypothetical protein